MPDSGSATSITIVVVPRERFSVAPRSLRSLLANTPQPYDLIYVDAGSPRGIRDQIAAAAAQHGFAHIRIDGYLSPTQARNVGRRAATGELVVFVDNDVLFTPGWLPALVACARETGAGLVTSLVQFGEPHTGLIHFGGGDLTIDESVSPRRLSENHRFADRHIAEVAPQLQRAPCDYGEFHCVLLRRAVLERLGPFDEELLSVCEHVDVGLALRRIGASVFIEPASRVIDYEIGPFTLADAAYASLRWGDDWNRRSLAHFAKKWDFDPDCAFFTGHAWFFDRQHRRVGLPLRPAGAIPADRPFAQTADQLFDELQALEHGPSDLAALRGAYDVAGALFSGMHRPCGKTFLAHAVGTASVLARFGANATVIAAGLLHAAPSHGQFPLDAGSTYPAQRSWLREQVGPAVEAMVDAYAHIPFDAEDAAASDDEIDELPIDIAFVAMIRVANEVDERLDHALSYSGKVTLPLAPVAPLFKRILGRLGAAAMLDLLSRLSADDDVRSVAAARAAPVASTYRHAEGTGAKVPVAIRQPAPTLRLRSAANPLAAIPRDAELVGLAVVKNECDVIEAFVRYNLRVLDGLAIIDHASSDRTAAIVERLRDSGLAVAILRQDGAMQVQAERMNTLLDLVRSTLTPRFVLPLDGDEFLRVADRGSLLAALGRCAPGRAPMLRWVTYVPTAADDASEIDPLRRIRHRRAWEPDQYYKAVVTAAALTDERCRIAEGNHFVFGPDGGPLPPDVVDDVALAHFPVRQRDQIRSKLCIGRMAMRLSRNREPGQGLWWLKLHERASRLDLDKPAGLQELAASYCSDEPADIVLDPLPDIPYDRLAYAEMIEVDDFARVAAYFDSFAAPALAAAERAERASVELANLRAQLVAAERRVEALATEVAGLERRSADAQARHEAAETERQATFRRLVFDLEMPEGPRALRAVLPAARLLRSLVNLGRSRRGAGPEGSDAGSSADDSMPRTRTVEAPR